MNLGELLRSSGDTTQKKRLSDRHSENEVVTDPLLLRWMNNIKERRGGA
ncbi:MAG: hypothetical protein OIN66_12135 [Candidatus Methanoperedens sp.]|nr:hypothetical protein [Candidatus Methanoperedens sp.]